MAPLSTLDIYVGLAAIAVAAGAIYLFIRASSSSKSQREPPRRDEDEYIKSLLVEPRKGRFTAPTGERILKKTEVDRAESKIRTLTLQSELLSIILKRLFEAEDDGEITREERIGLSKGYEADLKRVNGELKRAELVVTLNELETIREDILRKFEATLNSTQSQIDTILEELKIERKKEEPEPPAKEPPEEPEEEEEEPPEEEEEEEEPKRRPRSDVEERLEKLRSEVLKELDELDRLELEV